MHHFLHANIALFWGKLLLLIKGIIKKSKIFYTFPVKCLFYSNINDSGRIQIIKRIMGI